MALWPRAVWLFAKTAFFGQAPGFFARISERSRADFRLLDPSAQRVLAGFQRPISPYYLNNLSQVRAEHPSEFLVGLAAGDT